jgi:hypothetical protein
MPVKDPASYRDRNTDWLKFFAHARRRELSNLITPDLLREHHQDPRGISSRHSAALQDVLTYLQNQPIEGKSFVYAAVPYQKYYLGTLHVRGTPPSIVTDREYGDEREAVHALFAHRLASLGLRDPADAGGDR